MKIVFLRQLKYSSDSVIGYNDVIGVESVRRDVIGVV